MACKRADGCARADEHGGTCAAIDQLIARCYALDADLTSSDVNVLTRATLRAKPGHVFVVADFSGVEQRCLAWAAGDHAALEVIASGKDDYRITAAEIYGVPYESIPKSDPRRQDGKIAVLMCGYGGGGKKLEETAAKWGLNWEPGKGHKVVRAWRTLHAPIVQFWADTQTAATEASVGYRTEGPGPFAWGPSPLRPNRDTWLMLPSGRPMSYYNLAVVEWWRESKTWMAAIAPDGTRIGHPVDEDTNQRGGPGLVYRDRKGWAKTYGGSLVENAIQALCREFLARLLVRCEAEGLPVVLHIHDEVVIEVPAALADEVLAWLVAAMGDVPPWAAGMPLCGAGFIAERYCAH